MNTQQHSPLFSLSVTTDEQLRDLLVVILVGSGFQRAPGAFWVLHLFLLCPEHWHGSQCVVEKLRLHEGGIPMVEREAHGRSFLGPRRTCTLGVCLRVCELRAVGKAECCGLPSTILL